MNTSGDYPNRLRRFARTVVKNAATGQDVEAFTGASYLWCRIETNNSKKQKDFGGEQTGTDQTIYVRNFPTLKATDRLKLLDLTYIITSIQVGENELILDCTKFDDLTL